MHNLKAIAAGLLAVFLWAAIPALVKVGTSVENLSFLLTLRFAIAILLFLPLLPNILRKASQVPISQWGFLSVILGANYYFQGLAMHQVPASWYVVIFSLNPIIAMMLLKIPMNRNRLIGLAFAFLGTIMFVETGLDKAPLMALLYIGIGMLTWVLYTRQIRNFQATYNDFEASAVTQFVSLAASLLIWSAQRFPVQALTSTETSALVALGLTTPLAYYCFSYCLRVTPAFGIVSQYLEPVFGILIGVLFFGESLSAIQVLGATAIVFGATQVEKTAETKPALAEG